MRVLKLSHATSPGPRRSQIVRNIDETEEKIGGIVDSETHRRQIIVAASNFRMQLELLSFVDPFPMTMLTKYESAIVPKTAFSLTSASLIICHLPPSMFWDKHEGNAHDLLCTAHIPYKHHAHVFFESDTYRFFFSFNGCIKCMQSWSILAS